MMVADFSAVFDLNLLKIDHFLLISLALVDQFKFRISQFLYLFVFGSYLILQPYQLFIFLLNHYPLIN